MAQRRTQENTRTGPREKVESFRGKKRETDETKKISGKKKRKLPPSFTVKGPFRPLKSSDISASLIASRRVSNTPSYEPLGPLYVDSDVIRSGGIKTPST